MIPELEVTGARTTSPNDSSVVLGRLDAARPALSQASLRESVDAVLRTLLEASASVPQLCLTMHGKRCDDGKRLPSLIVSADSTR